MQVAGGLPTDTDPMIDEIVAYWRSLNHASVCWIDRRSTRSSFRDTCPEFRFWTLNAIPGDSDFDSLLMILSTITAPIWLGGG